MVRQIMTSTCGILFDKAALERAAISPIADPSSGDEERSVDDADSSEPLNDTLAGFSTWKILEILPLPWSVQDAQGVWHRKFGSVFFLGKQDGS